MSTVTWHMCDMTHWCAWPFRCPLQCAPTRSCALRRCRHFALYWIRLLCTRVQRSRQQHCCQLTASEKAPASWLLHYSLCDMTDIYVWYEWMICVTCPIRMRCVSCLQVWHDTCVAWLTDVRDSYSTHLQATRCNTLLHTLQHTATHCRHTSRHAGLGFVCHWRVRRPCLLLLLRPIYVYIFTYVYMYIYIYIYRYMILVKIAAMGEIERLLLSYVWMSHVTYVSKLCQIYEWVMSHVWMRHVTRKNESCHAYEWVMSQYRWKSRRLVGLREYLQLYVNFCSFSLKFFSVLFTQYLLRLSFFFKDLESHKVARKDSVITTSWSQSFQKSAGIEHASAGIEHASQ